MRLVGNIITHDLKILHECMLRMHLLSPSWSLTFAPVPSRDIWSRSRDKMIGSRPSRVTSLPLPSIFIIGTLGKYWSRSVSSVDRRTILINYMTLLVKLKAHQLQL